MPRWIQDRSHASEPRPLLEGLVSRAFTAISSRRKGAETPPRWQGLRFSDAHASGDDDLLDVGHVAPGGLRRLFLSGAGLAGLESTYDAYVRGKDGKVSFEFEERKAKAPAKGKAAAKVEEEASVAVAKKAAAKTAAKPAAKKAVAKKAVAKQAAAKKAA